MKPISKHRSPVAFLDRQDIDTDQIIPKQFLSRVQKTGYGQFLFYNWRYLPQTICRIDSKLGDFVFEKKVENPDFELNNPAFDQAGILITRQNFGCGSSREHAVWAILQAGFKVVIAPQVDNIPAFADIFKNNSFKNGLLTIELKKEEVDSLFTLQKDLQQPLLAEVDLQKQQVTIETTKPQVFSFSMPPSILHKLRQGEDDTASTLKHQEAIINYEKTLPQWI